MIIRNIMVMMGSMLLIFSFMGSVHSQDYEINQSPLQNLDGENKCLIFAQNKDPMEIERKRQNLFIDKCNIEGRIESLEKHIKELEERLLVYLEQAQLNYDQWVRRNGTGDASENMLNDMKDRREREELEINQQKRRLATLNDELKHIQSKLEALKMP